VGVAFKNESADDGAFHRARSAFPGDGRTSVQQQVSPHTGYDVAGGGYSFKDGTGGHHTGYGRFICLFNIYHYFSPGADFK
jgi:hypothetical protein